MTNLDQIIFSPPYENSLLDFSDCNIALSKHISSLIETTEDFAVVHVEYEENGLNVDSKFLDYYRIVPITKMDEEKTGKWMETGMGVYSNRENGLKMTRYEMLINFTLKYGREVNYEIEYSCNGIFSQNKIGYIGKLRK